MGQPLDNPLVSRAVKDDPDAYAFLRMVAIVLHTWDDLIDGDEQCTNADVCSAFTLALIDLPRNAFYRAHFEDLNPLLMQAITNWRIANELENQHHTGRDYPNDMNIAFIVRSSYVDLLTASATLIGGKEWGVMQGVEIRRWAHAEGFSGYLHNLAVEKAKREGTHHVL